MNIFGGPTSEGRNSQTVALIFHYNPILESSAPDLQALFCASAHLSSFWASSGNSKSFKSEPEVLEPNLHQKSVITPPILMTWHWNLTGWLIWLRWTSTLEIRTFWEQMTDLLSSKPHQTTTLHLFKQLKRKYFWLIQDFSYTLDAPASDTQGNLRSDPITSKMVEENPNGQSLP